MWRQPSSREAGLIRRHAELQGGVSGLCRPLLAVLCMAGSVGLAYMWQPAENGACMPELAFAALEVCSLPLKVCTLRKQT